MIELLSYGFMQNALIGGIVISLVCSVVGVFLVLRRLSLLGDGLAHLAFGGIALGLLVKVNPVVSALGVTAIGSLWIQKMISRTRVYGESATALILSLGVGIGILIIGIVKGFNADLFSYLFGSVLALSSYDLVIAVIVFFVVCVFMMLCYKQMVFMSFNDELARLSGVNTVLLSNVFAVITALVVVMTIRAVGILLVTTLLVLPALTALQLASSFRQAVIFSSVIGVVSVISGIIIAFYLDLPPAGTISVLLSVLFLIVVSLRKQN